MQVGTTITTYTVEPLDDPVPRAEPVERPVEPAESPVRTDEPVPAG